MTPEQAQLVKDSWARMAPDLERAGELFYNRLFQAAPDTRALFSGDVARQQGRFLDMLTRIVTASDDLEGLAPLLRDLGRRHEGYGVLPAHYEPFADALVWTLQLVLGPDLTPEAEAAWCTLLEETVARMRGDAATGGGDEGG